MAKRKIKSRSASRHSKTNKNSAWFSTIAIIAFLIAIAALATSASSSSNLAGEAKSKTIKANSCDADATCETYKLQARADIIAKGSIKSDENIIAVGTVRAYGDVIAERLVVNNCVITVNNQTWSLDIVCPQPTIG